VRQQAKGDAVASTLADRELLFEALALHLGFAPPEALERARQSLAAETTDKGVRSLAQVLVEQGALVGDRLPVLDLLVDDLLARHGGNLRQCLDGLSAFGRLRHDLERRLAGLESRHPTVPPLRGGKSQAPRDSGASNGASSPGDDQEDDEDEDDAPEFELSLNSPAYLGNRFQILHAHARGGIGVVSVAFDSELQREVALKQIKPENAEDADSRARFLLEAEVTGRLEHPGIVPVYGLGFDDQGNPYYAMRFVRGVTLEEAIARYHAAPAATGLSKTPPRDERAKALELRQLLGRFVSVCHTMAYAHSRSVLHRDLKPANVLLGPYNETLVVDWGLAKVLDRARGQGGAGGPAELAAAAEPVAAGEASGRPRRSGTSRVLPPLGYSSSTETIMGAAFGTPAFMSPEQAEGQLDRLGPPSDVYSLGAMLYTLLCGKPPFEYVWCDVTTLLARVKNGEFTPPRQVSTAVPRPLEAVCLKAMANRPEDRYRDAEALAGDIERWMADEPVAAYREPRWAQLQRWGRRHRPLVAGVAGLLLTALVGLTLGIILLGRAQRQTEIQRRRAVEQSEMATLMSGEANARAESLRRRDYINRVNLAYQEFFDDNSALAEQLLYGCPSALRQWEWAHVQRLAHLELDTLVGAESSQRQDVWSLAFSPDGRRLASGSGPWFQAGSAAGTAGLVVREVGSGREVLARRGEPGAVQAVAFSPDGKKLAAARGTNGAQTAATLTLLDAATGQPLWTIQEPGTNLLGLAFAPDGKTIACGCGGFNDYSGIGYVRFRDSATGKERGRLVGGPGGVTSVAYSPDGTQLAAASRGQVDVWDLKDHVLEFRLPGHVDFVYAVAFSPDGRWLASGGWDRSIRLWDRSKGTLARTLLGHRGFVRGLSFRPDGMQLISCSEDKSVRLWDVASGRPLASFHGHAGFVHCVAFSPDGVQAASGSLDGTIKLWPAAAPDPQVTFRNGSGWVGTLAFAPDGKAVASSHNGGIRLWDPRTGEERWRVSGPVGLLGRIALIFAPDGKALYASAPDGGIQVLDAASGRVLRALARPPAQVVDAAISPDGNTLAAACEEGKVLIWDLAGGDSAPPRVIRGHAATVNAVAFAPDGRRLATASEDREVKLWDLAGGAEVATLRGHVTGVKDVAFAPDGAHLVSVGGQYRGKPAAEVLLWDAASGVLVRRLEGHTSLVTAASFAPDGRRLFTASDDRTIKLWDPETGEDVFTLRGHTSGVVSLAVSRDGRQVASGSIDCTARIWSDEPAPTEVDLVRRRAAVELVQLLFEAHQLKDDVLQALRADRALEPAIRASAIEIAGWRGEDAQGLFEAAWLTVLRPGGSPEGYAQALRKLEAACRIVAGDSRRLDGYRHALALAFYRAGRPEEALRATEKPGGAGPRPVDLAVRALASQRLGRYAEARAALEQLRTLAAGPGSADQEAVGFLEEAESVVHE
jgi:WD40 repeat protein/serine/threonine protein kinase